MATLGELTQKIRSKNAGPFWLTIDIFCGNEESFQNITSSLTTARIATLLHCDEDTIKRFDIPDLNVIKFSLPRPQVQGSLKDRDMHGASWAALVSELDVN